MVYVDELVGAPAGSPSCFRYGYCHLTADSVEELHIFAVNVLGMRARWFQNKRVPHYDLTKRRRELAIQLGAVFKPAKEQARERMANVKQLPNV